MQYLKERILKDGKIKDGGILKVDSFLNHQIDVECINEIGKEFKRRFGNQEVTKILTIEASGIAIAVVAAQYFNNVPVVFAKKVESKNLDVTTYEAQVHSYTKDKMYTIRVSQNYLNENDKVLIIDDFLAHGSAALGLIDLVKSANAEIVGVGIVIEKSFQEGGRRIRETGVQLESLARVRFNEDNSIVFE